MGESIPGGNELHLYTVHLDDLNPFQGLTAKDAVLAHHLQPIRYRESFLVAPIFDLD